MDHSPLKFIPNHADQGVRMTVELEFDAKTGEITALSGDPEAIRRSCSFLLGKVGMRGTRLGRIEGDGNRHDSEFGASKAHGKEPLRDTATNTPGALVDTPGSDEDIRHRARPAFLLAALRREREFSSAALRLTGSECERELRSESRDASPTPCQERELPAVVGPRDRRMLERDSFDHSPNTDARSGGNGNAAGSGPAVGRRRGQLNDTPDLVSPLASPGDAERDAFPPRSSGEGDLARGFAGEDVGPAGLRIFQEAPVGGASSDATKTGGATSSGEADVDSTSEGPAGSTSLVGRTSHNRSGLVDRSRQNGRIDATGVVRIPPVASRPSPGTRGE